MKKTRTQLIKESIADANAITNAAEKRTAKLFLQEFSGPMKSMLSDIINEQASTGSDQPGGYAQDADKDAIASGKDINDGTGDGPDNLQEGDTDIVGDDENPEDQELGEGFEADGEEGDNTEDEFNVDENSDGVDFEDDKEEMYELENESSLDDEIPSKEDDQVIEIVDDTLGGENSQEEDPLMESDDKDEDDKNKVNEQKYKKAYIKLAKEHKVVLGDVKKLREGFNKLNLFNAKLAYAFKLMRTPGLTRTEKKQIAETFDRVKSIREAKLIYETLKKTVVQGIKTTEKKNPIQSKNIKSVKSEQTKLNESMSNRMSVLAFGEED